MRMRREQSGPHTGVLAHHPGILLRMAPMCPSFQPPPAQRPSPLAPLSARPWLSPHLWAWTPTAPDTHCFQPPDVCKVSGPRGFPGSPGAMTSPSNARGADSIPSQGGNTPCVSWPNKQTKGLWPAFAELMLGAVDLDTDEGVTALQPSVSSIQVNTSSWVLSDRCAPREQTPRVADSPAFPSVGLLGSGDTGTPGSLEGKQTQAPDLVGGPRGDRIPCGAFPSSANHCRPAQVCGSPSRSCLERQLESHTEGGTGRGCSPGRRQRPQREGG